MFNIFSDLTFLFLVPKEPTEPAATFTVRLTSEKSLKKPDSEESGLSLNLTHLVNNKPGPFLNYRQNFKTKLAAKFELHNSL